MLTKCVSLRLGVFSNRLWCVEYFNPCVLEGLQLCTPRLFLGAPAVTPPRVMFICGHGCVVLGLCCIDAVRFRLKSWYIFTKLFRLRKCMNFLDTECDPSLRPDPGFATLLCAPAGSPARPRSRRAGSPRGDLQESAGIQKVESSQRSHFWTF